MADSPARLKELFIAALDLPDPIAREAWLEEACRGDHELRERIDRLLAAHDQPATALGNPWAKVADAHIETQTEIKPEEPGQLLAGRYKLLEQIGEGGMGSVWLAEQKEPIKRKVAIKLIKAGMDTKSVLARFDAKRQALALMDHPNIAKVFDGGMTEQGRPYFVMEYVKGVPLTRYCDQARLPLQERLQLFASVCQAVQHAHQKGIIHRDLKPSNILICLYDGRPVPKVIDFGLAKAMHQSLTEHSLHTGHGVMVGTPLYMSPEQAEHNNLDVDTRSDIYSLGVILYELLTGSTPLEKQQLREAAYKEILRLIKEVDPPKPSSRLSGSASLPSVAAQRSIEPKQLSKLLSGDLDWIVMKSLDKDRGHRYETANGLARDIERYLNNEAVEACPPSTTYRLKKLIRRNKGRVLAASLILLTLVAGTAAVLTVQARANANLSAVNDKLDIANDELRDTNKLLEQQRTRAEEREQEAIKAVKRFSDVVRENPELKNNPALEKLRKALLQEPLTFLQKLRKQLQDDKDTQPESLSRLATAVFELAALTGEIGDKQGALQTHQESRAILDRLLQVDSNNLQSLSNLADCILSIGFLQITTGRTAEAHESYRNAKDILERLAEQDPTGAKFQGRFQGRIASLENNIGLLKTTMGQLEEAMASYNHGREILEGLAQQYPNITRYQSELAKIYNNLANVQKSQGQLTESLNSLAEAKKVLERLIEEKPNDSEFQSDLSGNHYSIGNLQHAIGKRSDALASHYAALKIRDRLARENPTATEFQSNLASSHQSVGALLRSAGKNDEALKSLYQALELHEKLAELNPTVPEFESAQAKSHFIIGNLHAAAGNVDEALASYVKAREIQERFKAKNPDVKEFHDNLAKTHNNIGVLLRTADQPVEALASFARSLEIQEELALKHPDSPDIASELGGTLNNMATIDLKAGRFNEARERLLRAIESQRKALDANPRNPSYRQLLTSHFMNLVNACAGLKDYEGTEEAKRQFKELVADDPRYHKMDQRLEAIAKGEPTRNNAECLLMADRAYYTRQFALAARLWAKALEAEPKLGDDRKIQHRYNAACCAAMAASGEGKNNVPLDDIGKEKLRNQSLIWLTDELEIWSELLEAGKPEDRSFIAQTLKHWQKDGDLRGIRDATALSRFPEPERAEWEKFWKEVDVLLSKSLEATEPENKQ